MNFKLKTLVVAVSIACGAWSLPALASIPVTVQSSVFVNSNGTSASNSNGPTDSVNSGASVGNSYGSAVANNTGLSYLRTAAYTSDTASDVVSNIHQLATITNDTGSAQSFSFNFLINRGYLIIEGNSPMSASYSADILLNGHSIWNSSAVLTGSGSNGLVTKSGTDLNGQFSTGPLHSQYIWNAFTGNLNLGVFGAGQTFSLDYALSASSATTAHAFHECTDGYGSVYANTSCPDFAGVGFGDPNGITMSPINNATILTSPVPEPSSLALLGAGLAGLAFRRKAKKA